MANYTDATKKFLHNVSDDRTHWQNRYKPGQEVPVSGIYKCTVCKKEVTSNKGDPFPPQNHHQHSLGNDIEWQLIIRADTDGNKCGAK